MSLDRDLETLGLTALKDRAGLRARYVSMVEVHAPERDADAWLRLARAYGRLDAQVTGGHRPAPGARVGRDPEAAHLDAVLTDPDMADDVAARFEHIGRDPAAASADDINLLLGAVSAHALFALARHALSAGHGGFAIDLAAKVLRADHGEQPTVPPTEPIALLLRIAAAEDEHDPQDFVAALLGWIAAHGPAYDLLSTQEVALLAVTRELLADPCDMPRPLRRAMARALLAGDLVFAQRDLESWANGHGWRAQALAWRLRRHGSGTAIYAVQMLGRPNGVGPLSVGMLLLLAFIVVTGGSLAIGAVVAASPVQVLVAGAIGMVATAVAVIVAHRWSASIWRRIYRPGTDGE